MRIGIDFGTTRIVVSAADRGNYPVIAFEDVEGTHHEWFPPLVAIRGKERRYGWEAHALQADADWTLIRSLKRCLKHSGPQSTIYAGNEAVPVNQLLREMCSALAESIRERSTLPAGQLEALEALAGVPANAHSNQRFLTSDALKRGGIAVLGLGNEPAAAAVEYGHAHPPSAGGEQILVYDLGGGTFDAALVSIDESSQTVVATEGVSDVGGDDFDAVLAAITLEREPKVLSTSEHFRLLEECRVKKEALHPNSRRVTIDLGAVRDGWPEVSIPINDYYDRCRPLVDRTVEATARLLGSYDTGQRLAALYITGGGSDLPLVARVLRETFGRRVKRSAYARSATAIGLAIQADTQSPYELRDRFSRYFGVWREVEDGSSVTFDSLFDKGTPLPAIEEAPLSAHRRYRPAHNIGHFRFLECSNLSEGGRPTGHITAWDEVLFPFDPSLQDTAHLHSEQADRSAVHASQEIEETYTCDASGVIFVRIANLTAGYSQQFQLAQWAAAKGNRASLRIGKL